MADEFSGRTQVPLNISLQNLYKAFTKVDICRAIVRNNYMGNIKHIDKIKQLIMINGMIRPKELAAYDISRSCLKHLVTKGDVVKISRGVYVLSSMEIDASITLAEITKRVPNCVICLLSALQYHELTSQLPNVVWVALPRKAWRPVIDDIPHRFVFMKKEYISTGIEKVKFGKVEGKVFSVARTIADCFKYRNKIGIDIAIEALKDSLAQNKVTVNEIMHYAKICRVQNIIKPYVEALIG